MISNIASNYGSKSQIHKKRQIFQQARVHQQREKVKKTQRFEHHFESISKKQPSKYNYITQVPSEQVQTILQNLMLQHDLVSLLYCTFNLKDKYDLQELLDNDFLQKFIQFSQNQIEQPQIILIYKVFCSNISQFIDILIKFVNIIQKIVLEIKSLKPGFAQNFYLEVFEKIALYYPKRYQQEIGPIFNIFSQLIEDNSIQFESFLKILKAICPFINQDRNLSLIAVETIIKCYENQIKNQKQPNHLLLQNSFIILVKIIYYQQNTDVIMNMRLIKIMLHAKQNLPPKFVEEYHNIFLLVAKLIAKTGEYEWLKLNIEDFQKAKEILIKKYRFPQIDMSCKDNYLTTSILNGILEENKNLLKFKQFSVPYLNIMLNIFKYSSTDIIIKHFIEAQFFEFLTQAVEFSDIDINGMSLEIIGILISKEVKNKEILYILKAKYNLPAILEERIKKTHSSKMHQKTELILQKFEQFYRC